MKTSIRALAASLLLLALASCEKAKSLGADGASSSVSPSEPGRQLVAITVGEDGFAPNRAELKRGIKATLRFMRTTDSTCAKAVAFPELGLNKPLPLKQPVDIEIPTEQSRTMTFQCGMGMYQSKVLVL